MPRMYIAGTEARINGLINRIDREAARPAAVQRRSVAPQARPRPLSDAIKALLSSAAVQTGTVREALADGSGFLVNLGQRLELTCFLPIDKLAGASPVAVGRAGRVKVRVTGIDGSRDLN